MGFPTVENLKHILKQRLIRNCPIAVEDVNIAEQIYGSDISSMKGKKTRPKAKLVRNDHVKIPPEIKETHDNLTLHIDIMFVNNLLMLTSIDDPIRYRAPVPLNTRTASDIYKALDVILCGRNDADFTVKEVRCDREFRSIMDAVKDDLNITINYPPKGEKDGTAEQNNRTIGERVQAIYHYLPYKMVPKIMLKCLAMVATQQLNYFPAKGGVSPYYSPHVIMKHRDLDYEKHCQVPG